MISFKNIFFDYDKRPVFQDFSLEIEQGSITSILGSSGCGKTSLLRLIAGFETPEKGEIWMNGNLYTRNDKLILPPSKRNIGYVFQDLALWPHFTVYQNIAFVLSDIKKQSKKTLVKNLLIKYHLEEAADRYPHQLSGGQQQLLAIARAMATRPDTILFDEPLNNLDVIHKTELLQIIKNLKKKDSTIIYVTHDHREAFKIADKIIVLNQGKIEAQGTLNEIKNAGNDYIKAMLSY